MSGSAAQFVAVPSLLRAPCRLTDRNSAHVRTLSLHPFSLTHNTHLQALLSNAHDYYHVGHRSSLNGQYPQSAGGLPSSSHVGDEVMYGVVAAANASTVSGHGRIFGTTINVFASLDVAS